MQKIVFSNAPETYDLYLLFKIWTGGIPGKIHVPNSTVEGQKLLQIIVSWSLCPLGYVFKTREKGGITEYIYVYIFIFLNMYWKLNFPFLEGVIILCVNLSFALNLYIQSLRTQSGYDLSGKQRMLLKV